MAKQIVCKYKVVIRYIDNIDVFIEEDSKDKNAIDFELNYEQSNFVAIGNKLFNIKDIVYIEELKGE